ncbi:MAG: MmcQ/YjbR family DNA-binding protein [Chloroflexota bacterium]
MATHDDVRRLATALPEAIEEPGFSFSVCGKAFAWVWRERVEPKRARVLNPDVIAVRVANELEKQALLGLDPDIFFTEPHYNGYPAVLVRVGAIDPDLLEKVLSDAWRTRAPKRLVPTLDR